MSFFNFLSLRKTNGNAKLAKERLQIIVAEHRRAAGNTPHYLPQLKQEIFQVICKYVQVDPSTISVQLERHSKDTSILELNVTLPEAETLPTP